MPKPKITKTKTKTMKKIFCGCNGMENWHNYGPKKGWGCVRCGRRIKD